MKNKPQHSDDVNALEQQARVNRLRLKIARQNQALGALRRDGYSDSLEGFYDRMALG
jgi:hypothetical protein